MKALEPSGDFVAQSVPGARAGQLATERKLEKVQARVHEGRQRPQLPGRREAGRRPARAQAWRSCGPRAEVGIDYFLLERAREDTVIQEHAPGYTNSACSITGIRTTEQRTRIFSVTEKRFPAVTGDGKRRTLEELILGDERTVCMAEFYLHKGCAAASPRVPAEGDTDPARRDREPLPWRTVYYDGSWILTPAIG